MLGQEFWGFLSLLFFPGALSDWPSEVQRMEDVDVGGQMGRNSTDNDGRRMGR
jgi:hypothetical protein